MENDTFTDPEWINQFKTGKDFWRNFLVATNQHGLDAWAHGVISKPVLVSCFPPAILQMLEQRICGQASRIALLLFAFEESARIFRQANIPFVPLKGVVMLHQQPEWFEKRLFSDIDLLVSEEHARRGWELLKTTGFSSAPFKGRAHERWVGELHHHYPPLYSGVVSIEIHTRLAPTEAFSWSRNFMEAARTKSETNGYNWPDPIHHLLFLISHLDRHGSHGQFQLRLARDIALLAGPDRGKWKELARLARQYGQITALQRVYPLICRIWQWSDLFQVAVHTEPPVKTGQSPPLLPTGRIPGRLNRLKLLLNMALPGRDYMLYIHPGMNPALLPWYHIKRIVKGMVRRLLF